MTVQTITCPQCSQDLPLQAELLSLLANCYETPSPDLQVIEHADCGYRPPIQPPAVFRNTPTFRNTFTSFEI